MKTTARSISIAGCLCVRALLTLGAGVALLVTQLGGAEPEMVEVDSVSVTKGKLMAAKAGKSFLLEKTARMPFEIKVSTNSTFRVSDGKPRPLKEGQVLSEDGNLTSPDGSITPVFDHVTMKQGRVILSKDGEASPLAQEMKFPDGSRVTPDATYYAKNGNKRKLLDGEVIKLDGSSAPAVDSVALRSGKVVVQKDGSLITLRPGQNITMADGTKVASDGNVIKPDGARLKLAEGEILPIQGVVVRPR